MIKYNVKIVKGGFSHRVNNIIDVYLFGNTFAGGIVAKNKTLFIAAAASCYLSYFSVVAPYYFGYVFLLVFYELPQLVVRIVVVCIDCERVVGKTAHVVDIIRKGCGVDSIVYMVKAVLEKLVVRGLFIVVGKVVYSCAGHIFAELP